MAKYRGAYRDTFLLPDEDEPEVTPVEPTAPETPPEPEGWEKRYSDLRRYAAQKEAALEARIKELEKSGKQASYPRTADELKEWMDAYPTVAANIETLVRMRIDEAQAGNETGERVKALETQIKQRDAYAALLKEHPDFEPGIRTSKEFKDWVANSSDMIKNALSGWDVRAASDAIKMFKLETGYGKKPSNPVDTQRQAAQSTPRTPAVAPSAEGEIKYSESIIKKMSHREYLQHEKAIDKAIPEGKFEYDLSAGAR